MRTSAPQAAVVSHATDLEACSILEDLYVLAENDDVEPQGCTDE